MAADEQETLDLVNIAGGAAVERFEDELQRVLENIEDLNTGPTDKREITLTFKFKPNAERNFAHIEVHSKSKLAPPVAGAGQAFMGRRKGRLVAVPHDPEQLQLKFDEESRPRVVDDERRPAAGE